LADAVPAPRTCTPRGRDRVRPPVGLGLGVGPRRADAHWREGHLGAAGKVARGRRELKGLNEAVLWGGGAPGPPMPRSASALTPPPTVRAAVVVAAALNDKNHPRDQSASGTTKRHGPHACISQHGGHTFPNERPGCIRRTPPRKLGFGHCANVRQRRPPARCVPRVGRPRARRMAEKRPAGGAKDVGWWLQTGFLVRVPQRAPPRPV